MANASLKSVPCCALPKGNGSAAQPTSQPWEDGEFLTENVGFFSCGGVQRPAALPLASGGVTDP